MIDIAAHTTNTRSEGPGTRFAIWMQGCSIRCPGCCNPEMIPREGGTQYSVDEMFERISTASSEGVSFLGGEPFNQATELGLLAQMVRRAGMGVMTFSGYTCSRLLNVPEYQMLIKNTDLLKTGPYIQALHSVRRRWIGSENQELHFLTGRYREHPDIQENYTQGVSIDLAGEEAVLSGWPL